MDRKKINFPEDFLEHLKAIASSGGSADTEKQYEHRRKKAVKAMLHKRFPHDPRWL